MFDQRFFASKLGHAAMASMVAMITFAIITSMQLGTGAELVSGPMAISLAGMELA